MREALGPIISHRAGASRPHPPRWGTEEKSLSEPTSLLFAAERSAGIVQIIQLNLDRRDGALQVFVLILFSRDLIGVGGVIL